jgi:methylated-DNA-[protein]-cysteine S-methyltransferase
MEGDAGRAAACGRKGIEKHQRRGRDMESDSYVVVPSTFGAIAIVWRTTDSRPMVQQVFLPSPRASAQRLELQRKAAEQLVQAAFAGARLRSHRTVEALGARITSFLAGDAVEFGLQSIALDGCSEFQQRVLLAEHGIPRGWVSTYGRIARHLGVPGAARAVGRALAQNPFPIIIPCHRAVRAGGELGGYQGGVEMKRALLECEGVPFSEAGRVVMRRVYY